MLIINKNIFLAVQNLLSIGGSCKMAAAGHSDGAWFASDPLKMYILFNFRAIIIPSSILQSVVNSADIASRVIG